MKTFREFLEEAFQNLEEKREDAITGLLGKADAKRILAQKLRDIGQLWDPTGRKIIGKLDKESRKHSNSAAKLVIGK